MDVRSKVYTYHTSVAWTAQRKGVISYAGKPDLQIAPPPEFKGHDGIWLPEDLANCLVSNSMKAKVSLEATIR